jgi:hypothetical protein
VAIKTWAKMLDDIAPDLPQCPIALIEHQLRKTTIALCTDSGAYRVDCDAMDIVSGESEQDLDLPTQTELVGVVDMTLDGNPVTPIDTATLSRQSPSWRTDTGTPTNYYGTGGDTVRLYPIPNATLTAKLYATVQVRPIETADGIEAWVYRKYGDGIVAGAKAELKAMLGKPWSDPAKVAMLRADYERTKADAVSDGVRSHTNTARRVVPCSM